MSIIPDLDERLRSTLNAADYLALAHEIRSLRNTVASEKERADINHDTITRLNRDGAENARLAQIGRTVALRFSNPHITYGEEREARQKLIDAHLGGDA